MNNKLAYLLLTSVFVFSINVSAQQKNKLYVEYINQYSSLAMEEMNKYKIPASITLAQGILESGAGQSRLARQGNNHFGIKCGGDWKGATIREHDDARNECFRKYKSAKESYEDHSKFLAHRARYQDLFKLNIADYKGWARGLKKAGYATDPQYANRLITIIEDYELYKYDSKGKKSSKKTATVINPHQLYLTNDLVYIVARRGDTFKDLSKELGISERKLIKYNDLHKGYTPATGDIVFLKEKKKKAAKNHTVHVVRNGDSMHGISQLYGIRLKNLYKMNKKEPDYVPAIGDKLRLR